MKVTHLLPAAGSGSPPLPAVWASTSDWSQHDVEVAPYAVVRLSALEYPQEAPQSAGFRRLWRRLTASERTLRELAGPLADALYESQHEHATEFHRRVVLPIRRDVHNGRAPRAAVRATLDDLSARVPLLARWLDVIDEREICRAELQTVTAEGLAGDRQVLSALCAAEPLRRAVAFTSQDLLRGLDRAAEHGAHPDARGRKAEPNVLRYALRASSKTSPLSWFTYVGWGEWSSGSGDELPTAAPTPHSRVNSAISMHLLRHILAVPGLRDRVPHRLAPAMSVVEDSVGYRRDVPITLTRMLAAREDQVTLPATPPLRMVLAVLAKAGPVGVTPEHLCEELATRIPGDREGARSAAAQYIDRLLGERLLVPLEPVCAQRDDMLAALATWLHDHGREELSSELRAITDESRRFASAPAQERPGALRGLADRWARTLAAVGTETGEPAAVTEDVVIDRRATLGRRHGEQARTDLVRLAPLAELFDSNAVLRRLIRDQVVARWGPGGRCRLADLVTDFERLLASVTSIGTDGTVAPDADASGPLPAELRDLARLRRDVTDAVWASRSSDADEVELPGRVLAEATAALPAWLLARPASYSYFVQPFHRGDRVAWCINHVYCGWGRFGSRFLDLLDRRAASEVAAQLGRFLGAERIAQYRPAAGFNANLHPLLVADEVGEDPAWANVLVDKLELVHDLATDQVRIRFADTGEALNVLYLGFLAPFMLPDRLAPLFLDLTSGRTSLTHLAPRETVDVDGHRVTRRARLRYRDVVIARRAWTLDETTVEALRLDLERDEDVPAAAAAQWAARLGLPEALFVTNALGSQPRGLADYLRLLQQPKPQYVDLGSALHLRCLSRLLVRRAGGLRLEEALPVPGTGPVGRRAVEFVVETYRARRDRTNA